MASAFWKLKNFNVKILFPNQKISKRQEHQLTCWGENIQAFAVEGTFDDCQRMVKYAFQNLKVKIAKPLISANSISIGRILPQMVYYAYASTKLWKSENKKTHFYIPTGNAGNVCAAIRKSHGFSNWKNNHDHKCKPNNFRLLYNWSFSQSCSSISTLANAMDVGLPSNFERILYFFNHNHHEFCKWIEVQHFSDNEISEIISKKHFGRIICPHTATAYDAVLKNKHLNTEIHVAVGILPTAKFENIVEPLVGT